MDLKVSEGVFIRRRAPATAPTREERRKGKRRPFVCFILLLKPKAPEREPTQRATVLVMLATTGSSPSHTRVGKVISVPPPATEFIAPASTEAPKAKR